MCGLRTQDIFKYVIGLQPCDEGGGSYPGIDLVGLGLGLGLGLGDEGGGSYPGIQVYPALV